MKPFSRKMFALLAVATVFYSTQAQAGIGIGLGSGMTWLRSSAIQNSGSPVLLGDIELGGTVKNGAGFVGAFVVGNLARSSTGTQVIPTMWGFVIRAYFGNSRLIMVDARLDPLSLITAMTTSGASSTRYFSWSVGFGIRIGIGKVISLVPYVSWRDFTYPYNLIIAQPRYFGPEAGLRLVIGQ